MEIASSVPIGVSKLPRCRLWRVVIFCNARMLENIFTFPETILSASGREEFLPKSVEILGSLLVVAFAPTFSVPKYLTDSTESVCIVGLLNLATSACSRRNFCHFDFVKHSKGHESAYTSKKKCIYMLPNRKSYIRGKHQCQIWRQEKIQCTSQFSQRQKQKNLATIMKISLYCCFVGMSMPLQNVVWTKLKGKISKENSFILLVHQFIMSDRKTH